MPSIKLLSTKLKCDKNQKPHFSTIFAVIYDLKLFISVIIAGTISMTLVQRFRFFIFCSFSYPALLFVF